ncbi:MFS transporter [Pseudactinotalea suaedae]|uniref:MFS transporter n=1 Tax=Pseudactinotalea suaedae TaxID=1524924 RepID=UPI0012E325F4|nr:MFS transporter [Pseudactinotalea suaedae]
MTAAVERRPLGANYRKLFGSAVSANLGDGLMAVALVWLASAVTRDPVAIAVVGVASKIPWLVFSLPAGVISDRFDRRRLVAWMDVCRVVVIAGLGLLVLRYQSGLPTPQELAAGAPEPASAPVLVTALVVASLLLGCAEVLRDNTAQTLMPAVVRKDQLEKANGRMWAAETTMNNFVGPPLGGVLIAVALAVPFLINAGLLAVSAALVFALAGSFAPGGAAAAVRGKIDWKGEIKEGFTWLWSHRLIRSLAILLGLLNLLSNVAFITSVLYVQDVLGLYEGWQFGLVTTGFAAGAVIGSLTAERVTARLSPGTALLVSILGMGTATLLMGLLPWAIAFWACGVAAGVFVVVWNVITVSLRQRLIPDRLLGRVNSVYRFFGWGTISLGALLGGALVAWGQELLSREWALRSVYLISGVLTLALLGYAARRVNTAQIRAAEAAAEAEAARDEAGPTTGEASPVEETSSAVGDA